MKNSKVELGKKHVEIKFGEIKFVIHESCNPRKTLNKRPLKPNEYQKYLAIFDGETEITSFRSHLERSTDKFAATLYLQESDAVFEVIMLIEKYCADIKRVLINPKGRAYGFDCIKKSGSFLIWEREPK